MEVGLDGTLPIRVLNTANISKMEYTQDFSIQTTTGEGTQLLPCRDTAVKLPPGKGLPRGPLELTFFTLP